MDREDSVRDLKLRLMDLTSVLPERQKLLGLVKGRLANDEELLLELNLKENQAFTMLGTPENEIFKDQRLIVNQTDQEDDVEILPDEKIEFEIRSMIEKYTESLDINFMSPVDTQKKLLVLDLDYTLFDHRRAANHISELMRPGMHDFLAAVSERYNLAIWSQTSRRRLHVKLRELGLLDHQEYKISFVLDSKSMFSITRMKRGLFVRHQVKCLELIWRKIPEFGPHNTIHVDDLNRNFALNPRNGLKISAFKNKVNDVDLIKLGIYLIRIADHEDLSTVSHKGWKSQAQ